MVVEYVTGRFGSAALQQVLRDLGDGIEINEALARHTEPIDKLDETTCITTSKLGKVELKRKK